MRVTVVEHGGGTQVAPILPPPQVLLCGTHLGRALMWNGENRTQNVGALSLWFIAFYVVVPSVWCL